MSVIVNVIRIHGHVHIKTYLYNKLDSGWHRSWNLGGTCTMHN